MPRFSKKTEKPAVPSNSTPNINAAINNLGFPPPRSVVPSKTLETEQEHGSIGAGQPRERTARRGRVSSPVSIGQDKAFNQVCDFLAEDDVGTVGIHGMGGVGKSTLMKKLRREFLEPSGYKVVWLVVSRLVDVDRIQKEIMARLNLEFDLNEPRYRRVERISQEVLGKKMALLMDDIWEGFHLEELEVLDRTGLDPSNFKLIFTTRLEDVCAHMQPNREIRVECFNWDDSWALFEMAVGKRAIYESHSGIKEIAMEIAKECKGLPLALSVIGKAMTCKYSLQAWKHALISLRKSPSMALEVEKTLFPRIKISFDHLSSDMEKNCFLYCCLYPEDETIQSNNLVDYWYAEGLLGLDYTMEEACNKGYDIIGNLQTANLLERVGDSFSKMHDVVRDMGLWILSQMEQYFFVHPGEGVMLTISSIREKWQAAHRIYVSKGGYLPEQPLCSNLTSLIFRHFAGTAKRIRISDAFFHSMHRLKVLELANISFINDPVGIGQLKELRFLYLGHTNLSKLPVEIGQLSKLKILYVNSKILTEIPTTVGHLFELRSLRFTFVRELPVEIGNLSKLECLFISSIFYGYLEDVPKGTFGLNMASLKILSLSVKNVDAFRNSELWDLTQLEDLTISLRISKSLIAAISS